MSESKMCPGLEKNRCGLFMATHFKDPNPVCSLFHGRSHSREGMCDICASWDENQWLCFSKVKVAEAYKVWKLVSGSTFFEFSDLDARSVSLPKGWLPLHSLPLLSPVSGMLPALSCPTIPVTKPAIPTILVGPPGAASW